MLAKQVAQALVQGCVAHRLDPTRHSYETFVLRISDNELQLQETAISSAYLEELYRGKSSGVNLLVSIFWSLVLIHTTFENVINERRRLELF